jgi:hypothetical protein
MKLTTLVVPMYALRAVGVLREMRNSRSQPSVETYNCVFKGMARYNFERSEDLLADMTNRGLTPTSGTIDAFVDGCIIKDRPHVALSFVQHMFNQHRIRPSMESFISIMKLFMEVSQIVDPKRSLKFLTTCCSYRPKTSTRSCGQRTSLGSYGRTRLILLGFWARTATLLLSARDELSLSRFGGTKGRC